VSEPVLCPFISYQKIVGEALVKYDEVIRRLAGISYHPEANMKLGTVFLCLTYFAFPLYAQDFALKQLNDSPRHHEWITVPSDGRNVHCFVVYTENAGKSLSVIVIHENRGLTDWVRSFTDQLAGAGYISIAPDLLSGFDAEHNRTSEFKSSDDARNALYTLNPDQFTADLHAIQKYASQIPSSNGKTAVIGFCWGGSQSFRFAADSKDLSAALVFYGSSAAAEKIPNVTAPVYGFYAENDQRINAAIPETKELMKKHRRTYEYEIYTGAGHGFMRIGDDPEGSAENRKARDDSWVRMKRILSQIK